MTYITTTSTNRMHTVNMQKKKKKRKVKQTALFSIEVIALLESACSACRKYNVIQSHANVQPQNQSPKIDGSLFYFNCESFTLG